MPVDVDVQHHCPSVASTSASRPQHSPDPPLDLPGPGYESDVDGCSEASFFGPDEHGAWPETPSVLFTSPESDLVNQDPPFLAEDFHLADGPYGQVPGY